MLAEKATSLLMFISVERKIHHPQDTHYGALANSGDAFSVNEGYSPGLLYFAHNTCHRRDRLNETVLSEFLYY